MTWAAIPAQACPAQHIVAGADISFGGERTDVDPVSLQSPIDERHHFTAPQSFTMPRREYS